MATGVGGNKEVRALVKKLRKLGYAVTTDGPGRTSTDDGRSSKRGNGHIRVLDSGGNFVGLLPNTPSSPRSLKNTIAMLRRRGVPL